LMKNSAIVPMLVQRIKIEQRLLRIIKKKDVEAFQHLFSQVKDYFGEDIAKEANELFQRLISVTKTLYGKNTAVLEFTKTDNQPGLLERIAKVFRRREVNLTGINSVMLSDRRIQFTISFEQAGSSEGVRRALEEIEVWKSPQVKVLA
jgi:AHAS-like ACT domain-containing protein